MSLINLTSKEIIQSHLGEFSSFLAEIGRRTNVRNFPVHAEVRRDRNGSILPIEINPMRFGGWCSTPDMTHTAYGFNPYVYYFSHRKPDWDEILKGREGKLYSIVVLDNSTGVEERRIAAFDYENLLTCFEKPLELRKINYREYPVFGFVFVETREENFPELERILKSDLKEFITIRE